MSEKSDEFKVQLLETFASLITAAFGLVAALAWHDTIKAAIKAVFGDEDDLVGMLVYAVIVTIIAVIMTLLISRSLSKAKKALHLVKEENKECASRSVRVVTPLREVRLDVLKPLHQLSHPLVALTVLDVADQRHPSQLLSSGA